MKTFLNDVIRGLSSTPKAIPSRYFYDDMGNKLFQQIMQLEEYYLPGAEMDIIENQTGSIIHDLRLKNDTLDVIELGAGDGSKTLSFIQQASRANIKIQYYPLDISPEVLDINMRLIHSRLPDVDVHPIAGNFFETITEIPKTENKRLILYMGSSIGNLSDKEIANLLGSIRSVMDHKDAAMIAFDLKKSPRTILESYDDSQGITRQFNLNLLHRINRELHADFDVSQFEHFPTYDPVSGTVYSYLISKREQTVYIDSGNYSFYFEPFEVIHTEISRKFSLPQIEGICAANGFVTERCYTDNMQRYAVALLRRKADSIHDR